VSLPAVAGFAAGAGGGEAAAAVAGAADVAAGCTGGGAVFGAAATAVVVRATCVTVCVTGFAAVADRTGELRTGLAFEVVLVVVLRVVVVSVALLSTAGGDACVAGAVSSGVDVAGAVCVAGGVVVVVGSVGTGWTCCAKAVVDESARAAAIAGRALARAYQFAFLIVEQQPSAECAAPTAFGSRSRNADKSRIA
jgi:hypothetical protein